MVVNAAARSGDFFSTGSSVSCSHRALPLSATVFISPALYPRHSAARAGQARHETGIATRRLELQTTFPERLSFDETDVLSQTGRVDACRVDFGWAGRAMDRGANGSGDAVHQPAPRERR